MGSKETRHQRGRRRGAALRERLLSELRDTRVALGISQRQLADALGCSQALISKREGRELNDIGVVEFAHSPRALIAALRKGRRLPGAPA